MIVVVVWIIILTPLVFSYCLLDTEFSDEQNNPSSIQYTGQVEGIPYNYNYSDAKQNSITYKCKIVQHSPINRTLTESILVLW